MNMKRVTYVRKGSVVIFQNRDAVSLLYGGMAFRSTRWVVSGEVFRRVRRQNPDVAFVKGTAGSK